MSSLSNPRFLRSRFTYGDIVRWRSDEGRGHYYMYLASSGYGGDDLAYLLYLDSIPSARPAREGIAHALNQELALLSRE